MADEAAAIRIGILFDHRIDDGRSFEQIVQLGIDDVRQTGRLDRPVELVAEFGQGLPSGTAAEVEAAFARLDAARVLAIIGPAISDNGFVARDLCDAYELAAINYTGGEQTRSEWMFHYQVGSLEEEPFVLARHLASRDLRTVALAQDRSPIGRRYGSFFEEATAQLGIEIVARVELSPVATDATQQVAKLRRHEADAFAYLGLGQSARPVSVAMAAGGWHPPAIANSALMFAHAMVEWRKEYDGWVYCDAYSDRNPSLANLVARLGPDASQYGKMMLAAAYDMGRLLAEGLAAAPRLDRRGVKEGLERVKLLPAALGTPDTTMGFGCWERAALKGGYLVLRQWKNGESVEWRG